MCDNTISEIEETERAESDVITRLRELLSHAQEMANIAPKIETPRAILPRVPSIQLMQPPPPPPPPQVAPVEIKISSPAPPQVRDEALSPISPHVKFVQPTIVDIAALNVSPLSPSTPPVHHRNISGLPPSDAGSRTTELRGYRLMPATIIREAPSYFYIAAIISTATSGGWVIISSFNFKTMITWICVVIFFYIFHQIKRNLACGVSSNGLRTEYNPNFADENLTLKMGETIYVEVMPVGIDTLATQVSYFPLFCSAQIIRVDNKHYARLTNLYRWHKLVIPINMIYTDSSPQ